MGRTKALIEIDGVPMATRVAAAMRAVGVHDILLVGGDPDELAPLDVRVVRDRYPGEGPIGGVITALHETGAQHVLVAACDLPDLDGPTIESLIARAGRADVVVASTDRIEPALAVWNANTLAAIEREFDQGVRALHQLLGVLHVETVQVDRRVMRNVNRPTDVSRLEHPDPGQRGADRSERDLPGGTEAGQ